MSTPKLLAISGALRAPSTNTMLLREAARLFGDAEIEFADIRFPLYDTDDEIATGIPAAVQKLADQIATADALIISTPEYNKGIPGGLKNALDWVSRCEGNPLGGKPIATMSAAAGRAGGERAQLMLRECLVPFGPRLIVAPEVAVHDSSNQFDEKGQLVGDLYRANLEKLMQALRAAI
ncbi:NADPH-dependent FMN reductase [Rhodalgimonas zhirmunskyi]|uniref:NAD(P)H-dependent oxidoreductase n=1 Tax=Rhodalgimonas zhirmunskyi TaxID=2964767 RepID=A0AAJ1X670_9RHOB|nr:NADPH-dependent FMN reductase [Rhodoalgimonas zhirmunskyi]MDQ2094419.1 NAD(P)H-dependent oxidoreductase [Rhodoalgimonas zhirmunskyi]